MSILTPRQSIAQSNNNTKTNSETDGGNTTAATQARQNEHTVFAFCFICYDLTVALIGIDKERREHWRKERGKRRADILANRVDQIEQRQLVLGRRQLQALRYALHHRCVA